MLRNVLFTSRRRTAGLAAALALSAALIPAVALADDGLSTGAAPKAGRWKISGVNGFTVTAGGKSAKDLRLSGGACQLKTITLIGSVPIHKISEGSGSNWIVGSADPSRKSKYDVSGIITKPVHIRTGGKTVSARLDLVFGIGGFTRDNAGVLVVKGCDVSFYMDQP